MNGCGSEVTIELYGTVRLRAGTGRLGVEAGTLGEALDGLGRACPGLEGPVVTRGTLLPAYRVSLNGERFVSDPRTRLAPGDVLLVLTADVGG